MKEGTIFWRNRERWFHKKDGDIRMADLAPHLEARYMLDHAWKGVEAEMGWRKTLRGKEGGRD